MDKDLIEKMQKGDLIAFRKFVDIYKEQVVRIAYTITGNLADAQDIAQEAFVRIFKNIKGFKYRCKLSTWVYEILINLCRDFLRKKKRLSIEKLQEENVDEQQGKTVFIDNKTDAAKNLLNKELGERIESAVSGLSPRQQLVFILKHKEGLKIEEIAQMANMSISTVKVHLFRAVHTLRKKLNPYLQSAK